MSHAFGLSQQGEREADLLYTSRRSITDPVTGVYCQSSDKYGGPSCDSLQSLLEQNACLTRKHKVSGHRRAAQQSPGQK